MPVLQESRNKLMRQGDAGTTLLVPCTLAVGCVAHTLTHAVCVVAH